MTKDRKRADQGEWVKKESSATENDVQILQLSSEEIAFFPEPEQPAGATQSPRTPKRGRWLDDVRTTLWQGGDPEETTPPRKTRQTAPLGQTAPPLHRAKQQPSRPLNPLGPSAPPLHRAKQQPGRPQNPLEPGPPTYPESQAIVPVAAPYSYQQEDRYSYDYQQRSGAQPLMLEGASRISIKEAEGLLPSERLVMLTRPSSAMAEQFRILALKIKESRGMRVIALVAPTSSGQGEVVACNVALALAEGERSHVLLIDANLRKPQVATFFGLRHEGGLSEQVRQHCRAVDDPWVVLHLTGKLHLLSSGAVEKNPSALLSSEAVSDLMAEARRFFDYIVISPPPVMESADMKILQDQLDGAILVARAGVTRGDSLKHSIRQIGAGKFVGTVLTGVKKLRIAL